jgi:3-hydroxyacyl-[acyl-carrier-protein] dehydratase
VRFTLIDHIDACTPGQSLSARKLLALGEEYLADHFPKFPVMPGVLMLEALVEAAAWLWRETANYEHTVITLREVKNVKYGTFMQPGRVMSVSVNVVKIDGVTAIFKGKGVNDAGEMTVTAQFTLHAANAADPDVDAELRNHWRRRWKLLTDTAR